MNDLPTLSSDFPEQDFVMKSNVPIKLTSLPDWVP